MSLGDSKSDDVRSFSNHLTHIELSSLLKWKLEHFKDFKDLEK